MRITLLGQAGFHILTDSGLSVMIDPYLSDTLCQKKGKLFERMVPMSEEWKSANVNVLLFTHAHEDHFDIESIRMFLSLSRSVLVCSPYSIFKQLKKIYPNHNYVVMRPSVEYSYGGLHIRAIEAFHEDSDSLGYVISADGVNAWFSGDTLFSRKIVEDIGDVHVDIAFISINGVGNNMNAVDAAFLIKLIEPDIAVPVHWDMFEHYGVDPTGFTSLFSAKDRTKTKVLKAYESIEF